MTTKNSASMKACTISSSSGSKAARAVVLGLVLVATCATAFAPPPAQLSSALGGALRSSPQAVRTRLERSASYTLGDSTSAAPSSSSRKPAAAFGWTGGKPTHAGAARPGPAQRKGDFSKLFAAPEPAPMLGGPLAGLSRSCATLAQGSCGSTPILFAMTVLVSFTFAAPFLVAAQTFGVWLVGRLVYWRSMGSADVSRRLPAGFVGYMSLFLVVGGLSFMNGLKGIALLNVV